MVISKQELTSKGRKEFDSDIVYDKSTFENNPLIISVEKCHGHVETEYVSSLTLVYVKLDASLIVRSTRSLKPLPYNMSLKDEFTIAYQKDETFDEDSMILLEDDELRLDNYFYSLIVSSLPLKIVGKDEDENFKGENWEVLSEDEYNKRQQSNEENSPFAALKDLDLN